MIKIVTDSTVYVKRRTAAEMALRIVPMSYMVNGTSYNESYADCNGDFESLLRSNGTFSTSQPNIAAFLSAFSEELSRGNEVLCITISSRLSGAYSAAYAAAKQIGTEKVVVFDSQLTAGGLYLLICEAKRLCERGESLSEITRQLADIREKITIAFSVDDMTPLRRSGRLGFVRMSVGTALNIKPILRCVGGAVVSDGVTRGSTGIIKRLVDMITPGVKEVVVNYIGNQRTASNLYSVIREKYPRLCVNLHKMGPVLGIHLGLQVVAVSFITE